MMDKARPATSVALHNPTTPQLTLSELPGRRLRVGLAGDWVAAAARPSAAEVLVRLSQPDPPAAVCFETTALGEWDSLLLAFVANVDAACARRGVAVDRSGLPTGVLGLLELADAVAERLDAKRADAHPGLLEQLGAAAIAGAHDLWAIAAFIGEAALGFGAFLLGRARYRRRDLWLLLQECGANALPIVSLISLLVGMILAFVGSVQLSSYGAQAYIADMVGYGMAREMGALMTAIIMTGRTGAAFAAQLGAMQVNDEIDALKTMGFSEIEFLVVPRMLALILMLPLLCVYADLLGMLGGALVSNSLFDISLLEYAQHILRRLRLQDFMVGVGKSAVFGVLVALSGCMRGMQCGRSSQAVGLAATSAVVTGIVMIVCADAVMALLVATLHW
ncbi:MAG: MlaE family ABC transporter permease [Candidatus Methylumidiphilus sp.]